MIFFLMYKNIHWILSKKQRKAWNRGSRKVSKSFLRKEKQKASIDTWEYCSNRYKSLFEDEKQKLVDYRRNLKKIAWKTRFQFSAIEVDKNTAILAQPCFQFLAIMVDENKLILAQLSDSIRQYIFLYSPLFFSDKEMLWIFFILGQGALGWCILICSFQVTFPIVSFLLML